MIDSIFVDMDGVLCDFTKRFCEMYGQEISDCESKKKYKIERKKKFAEIVTTRQFASLDPMPDFDEAIKFLKSIEGQYEIKILTSTANETYFDAASAQKREWLAAHDIQYPAIFVPGKRFKRYYAKPDSLLIDDTLSNIVDWRDAGSPAIWHKSWSKTILEVGEYK
jgi:beta-phosphoglucomutase-like phosphatase (HAD superfamily)